MPRTPFGRRAGKRTANALALAVLAPALCLTAVGSAAADPVQLNISMQAQQNTNWCWATSGDTIASFYG